MYYTVFSHGYFGVIPSLCTTKSDSLYFILEEGLRKLVIKKLIGYDEMTMTLWNDKEKVFEVDYNTTFNDVLPYIYDLPEYQQNKIKTLLMELKLTK